MMISEFSLPLDPAFIVLTCSNGKMAERSYALHCPCYLASLFRSLTFPSLPSVAKQELLQDWKDAACVIGGPLSGDSL